MDAMLKLIDAGYTPKVTKCDTAEGEYDLAVFNRYGIRVAIYSSCESGKELGQAFEWAARKLLEAA